MKGGDMSASILVLRRMMLVLSLTVAVLPMAAHAEDALPSPDSVIPDAAQGLISAWEAGRSVSIPARPTEALISTVAGYADLLGVPQDPAATIARAGLSDEVAGHLTLTLRALMRCHSISASFLSELSNSQIQRLLRGEEQLRSGAASGGLRSCAEDVTASARELSETFLEGSRDGQPCASPVAVWPVFHIKCHAFPSDIRHDYALIVDNTGDDDIYANNAGGNLLDVKSDPAIDPETPAKGCQTIPDLLNGECVVGASLLLDLGGDDTYGVMQEPDVDDECTEDLLIRRIVTGGSGLAGVGVLIDLEGQDAYTGKTLSQGSGHVGGVGLLLDSPAGTPVTPPPDLASQGDRYLAIRSSQGFALVGGLGVHSDVEGTDAYDFYMPQGEPGGVINDVGDCDDTPRLTLGAGSLGGVGVLMNEGGNDSYRSSASGQGFGTTGGTGVLVDICCWETYEGADRGNDDGFLRFDATSQDPTGVGIWLDACCL